MAICRLGQGVARLDWAAKYGQNDLISMVAEASQNRPSQPDRQPYHHALAQQRGRSITVPVRRPRSCNVLADIISSTINPLVNIRLRP
jgi:hypothetical protein